MRPAKRRRLSPSSGRLLPSVEFNLTTFRRHAVCFLLCVESRKTKFHPEIPQQFTSSEYEEMGTEPGIVSSVMSLPPSSFASARIESMLHFCVNGHPDLPRLPRTYSAFGSSLSDALNRNKRKTGRGFLEWIMNFYTIRQLVWFLEHFGQMEAVGIRACDVASLGKKSLVNSIVELFHAGTLPQARRLEEKRVLDGFNLTENGHNSLQIEFCGIRLPRELVLEILGFRGYDYETLVTFGLLGWDYYVFTLSTWDSPVVFSPGKNVFTIPNVIVRVMRHAILLDQLSGKELQYVLDALPRDRLEILKCSLSISGLRRLWRVLRPSNPLERLRKISFGRSYLYGEDRRRFRKFRLVTIAPNLEIVHFPDPPEILLGLQKLRCLKVYRRCCLGILACFECLQLCDEQLESFDVVPSWGTNQATEACATLTQRLLSVGQLRVLRMVGKIRDAVSLLNERGESLAELSLTPGASYPPPSELFGKVRLSPRLSNLRKVVFNKNYYSLRIWDQIGVVREIFAQLNAIVLTLRAADFSLTPSRVTRDEEEMQRKKKQEEHLAWLLDQAHSLSMLKIEASHASLIVRNRGRRFFCEHFRSARRKRGVGYWGSAKLHLRESLSWIVRSAVARFSSLQLFHVSLFVSMNDSEADQDVLAKDFASAWEHCLVTLPEGIEERKNFAGTRRRIRVWRKQI